MKNEFDHRALGASYNLFSFFEHEGPGLPVWHEKGLRIKRALIDLWRQEHEARGYEEIESPMMLDKSLWERSGHCENFAENMYFSSVDKRDYAIKPMNCPGALLYYAKKRRYAHDLPLRVCELGHVHRHESSGSLHGLMRVRSFVQDDAHIFCREDQLLEEILGVIDLIEFIMKRCGLVQYHFELSVRGESKKYLGQDSQWDFAEDVLGEALKQRGHQVRKNVDEAKFYGPSLDLHLKDVHGRSWQCSSVQLDFNLPGRFDIAYYEASGEKKVPYMVHRAIYGSLERFIGILLENYGKNLPLWLHPHHYRILALNDDYLPFAKELLLKLRSRNFYCDIDQDGGHLKERIKKAHGEFIHALIIIGKKEIEQGVVSVKYMAGGKQVSVGIDKLGTIK